MVYYSHASALEGVPLEQACVRVLSGPFRSLRDGYLAPDQGSRAVFADSAARRHVRRHVHDYRGIRDPLGRSRMHPDHPEPYYRQAVTGLFFCIEFGKLWDIWDPRDFRNQLT
jgi:hypothetical protein